MVSNHKTNDVRTVMLGMLNKKRFNPVRCITLMENFLSEGMYYGQECPNDHFC
jgi:hypothetical protein